MNAKSASLVKQTPWATAKIVVNAKAALSFESAARFLGRSAG